MEIALCSKRKIGFVTGTEKRDNTDAVKAEAWDTCNSMVISWLLASVPDQIKRAVMFTGTAEDIWKQLEATYSVANGSRKYQLCKAMYELKQNNKKIADYYTDFKLKKEEDEQKLFQFLNGLKEQYATLRSQILMMSPLPTVNTVCLPLPSKIEEDSGEDAEANFVEVAQCNMVQDKTKEWVIDSGITLGEVMYAPNFTHNLISVHKLTRDENCKVVFHPKFCLIQSSDNEEVKAVGKEEKGVYYLIDATVNKVITSLKEATHRKMLNSESNECRFSGNSELNIPETVEKTKYKKDSANLWH
ncbi:Retrovirus-related Pol polyprotein from transposon RE1 [Bienertia sinuspersici]